MYPLFESIKIVNGTLVNLDWHQQRVNQSRKKVLGKINLLILKDHIEIPPGYSTGVVKCRIPYGVAMGEALFSKYSAKKVNTLKQVECEYFDYRLKFQKRVKLDQLYQLRGEADEILITHNGVITDTSYSNVALYDGSQWYTPEQPLLEGTQRAILLASGKIKKERIHISNLSDFNKLVLINAMLEFETEESIGVDQIRLWDQAQVTF